MFWGALRSASPRRRTRSSRITKNPVLEELCRRIARQERRHFAYYFNQSKDKLAGRRFDQKFVKLDREQVLRARRWRREDRRGSRAHWSPAVPGQPDLRGDGLHREEDGDAPRHGRSRSARRAGPPRSSRSCRPRRARPTFRSTCSSRLAQLRSTRSVDRARGTCTCSCPRSSFRNSDLAVARPLLGLSTPGRGRSAFACLCTPGGRGSRTWTSTWHVLVHDLSFRNSNAPSLGLCSALVRPAGPLGLCLPLYAWRQGLVDVDEHVTRARARPQFHRPRIATSSPSLGLCSALDARRGRSAFACLRTPGGRGSWRWPNEHGTCTCSSTNFVPEFEILAVARPLLGLSTPGQGRSAFACLCTPGGRGSWSGTST